MAETQESPAKTPRHLWIVGIVALLWDAMGALDYVMTQTKNEAYMSQFTPEQLEFFYGFPAWVVGFWAIAVWGGLLGAVLLLMRRRLAAPVLLVSFVSMVVTVFHNYVLSNGAEIAEGSDIFFSVVIFVVALGLFIYAKRMTKNGILV